MSDNELIQAMNECAAEKRRGNFMRLEGAALLERAAARLAEMEYFARLRELQLSALQAALEKAGVKYEVPRSHENLRT